MNKKVAVAGIGMGEGEWIPEAVRRLFREAELVIGGRRVLSCLERAGVLAEGTALFACHEKEKMLERIKNGREGRIVAAVSGDPGFYSAAAFFREADCGIEASFYPGLSSLSYLCARLGRGWEDVCALSLHGREENLVYAVKTHRKTFLLTSGSIEGTAALLTRYGLGEVTLHMGRRLSEPGESILSVRAADARDWEEGPLSVLIENRTPFRMPDSIPDAMFVRGRAPMTKEYVRTLCADSFGLPEDAVIYDVGAGSGSVSVALGARVPRGRVYAFEKEEEAVGLIEANKRKFGMEHIRVIYGEAPGAFREAEPPDGVFIGGSGGRLSEILKALKKMSEGRLRLVITAVTLETLTEMTRISETEGFRNVRLRQVQISEAAALGSFHMLSPERPVFLLTADLEREKRKGNGE